jgi:hypothetical protein
MHHHDAGKCCVAESCAGAGAAAAELQLERCCIGARCAQKWWRNCFGAYRAHEASQTQQELGDVSS